MADQNSNININLKIQEKSASATTSKVAKSFTQVSAGSKQATTSIKGLTTAINKLGVGGKTATSSIKGLASAIKSLKSTNTIVSSAAKSFTQISTGSKTATTNVKSLSSAMSKLGSVKSTSVTSKNFVGVSASSKSAAKNIGILSKSMGLLNLVAKAFLGAQVLKQMWGYTKSTLDMIETTNLFNVSMGNLAKTTSKTVSELSSVTGLDTTGIMETVGGFNLLARSMGVASDKSQTLAVNSNQLALDLASLTNRSFKQVSDDLRSGLVGQSETMYKYGVDVTEAALKQEALNQGISKSVRNMTQAEKMQLRYAVILKQTSLSQGDFANTINDPANQLRILNERMLTLGRSIGSIFVPALKAILPVLNALASMATELADKMAAAFGYVKPEVKDVTNNFSEVTGEVDDAGESVDDLKKKMRGLAGFDQLNILGTQEETKTDEADGPADIDVGSYNNKIDQISQKSTEWINSMKTGLSEINTLWSKMFKRILPDVDFGQIKKDAFSISDSLSDMGSNISEDFMRMIPSIRYALGSTIEYFGTAIGLSLQVWFAGIADALLKLRDPVNNWSESVSNNLITFFTNVGSVVENLKNIFVSVYDENEARSTQAISGMVQNAVNIGMSLTGALSEILSASSTEVLNWVTENNDKIKGFITGLGDSSLLAVETANRIVSDMIGVFNGFWDKWGESSVTSITSFLMDIVGIFMDVVTNVIKPIFDDLMTSVGEIWDGGLKDVFISLGESIGSLISVLGVLWDNVLKPLIDWIIATVGPIIKGEVGALFDFIVSIFGGITQVISGALDFLSGSFKLIEGIFTGNKDLIRDGFVGMFNGVIDMLAGALGSIVNVVIAGINTIIRSINTVTKNTVGGPQIGELGFVDFRQNVPKLAEGGMLSAGQPFIAGEAGKELIGSHAGKTTVMPLENTSFVSAMKQAVIEGVTEAMGGSQQHIEVNVGGKTLVDEVIDGVNRKTRQTGKSVFNV